MEAISYCDRWNFSTRNTGSPISSTAAEQRHREGEPYTAIISEDSVPRFIVEVTHDYVGVFFLDEHQRPYLQYTFQEVTPSRPSRLFLTDAIHREYEGTTDK